MFKKIIVTLTLIISLSFLMYLFGSENIPISKYRNMTNAISEVAEFENDFASLEFTANYLGAGAITQDTINSTKLLADDSRDDLFLINSTSYEQSDGIKNEYGVFNSMTVSKNYFNYFDVYDANNNKIVISKDENRGILLVPEQYKSMESEINDYFTNSRKDYIEIDAKNFNENNPENYADLLVVPQEDQEKAVFSDDASTYVNRNPSSDVVIYYIKDDQYIQTFNTRLKSIKIKNPIINVLSDENIIVANTGFSDEGLYTYLDNMTLDEKYATLTDDLAKYNLNERYPKLVTLDENASLIKPAYLELIIVNSVVVIVTFIISILLVYFFVRKFFNNKTHYTIAIFIILAVSNYTSRFVGPHYNYAMAPTSTYGHIFITVLLLAIFLSFNKKIGKE